MIQYKSDDKPSKALLALIGCQSFQENPNNTVSGHEPGRPASSARESRLIQLIQSGNCFPSILALRS